MMDALLHDLRYALRSFRKSPGFTLVAICTLALGIGATTAIFSVVNGVLLRPLPYANPTSLVMLWNRWQGWPATWLSQPEYWDFSEQTHSFDGIAAFTNGTENLTGDGNPERVRAGLVTANAFPLLGVQPALGRVFVAEEDRPGSGVAVISDGLWRRRFGADPAIVGRSILLNDSSVTVLGVMPPGFQLPLDFTGQPMDLWRPLALNRDSAAVAGRGNHGLNAFARLKPGVTVAAANADVGVIATRMTELYPQEEPTGFGSFIVSVSQQVMGDVRPALLLLLGATGFVLLVACANVANLLLARSEVRQREVAVRTALGAGRGRLVRQMLTESVVLALAGGALGLLLADWGLHALLASAPTGIPRLGEVGMDGRVLAFALIASIGTGILFGLAPALHLAVRDLHLVLKSSGRGSTAGGARRRVRHALVVSEIAVAFVLVIGGALLIQSFVRLRAVDAGFNPANVLTMQISLSPSRYVSSDRVHAFYRTLIDRTRALPGVQSAGAIRALPMDGVIGDWGFTVEGSPLSPGTHMAGDWQVVSPGYFRTMQVPLEHGRLFTDADGADAPGAILMNEALARRAFPDGDAIGRRVRMGGERDWRTVVGIVGNVRQRGLDADIRPELYLPHAQFPKGERSALRDMYLVIRTAHDPAAITSAVRREVHALDPTVPIASVRTMDTVVGSWAAERRLSMSVLTILAAVALALAAVGTYGVMSYAVAQRTQEIGLRVALGAQPGDVVRLVVRQGAGLALAGVGIGLVAAFALTRFMHNMLYQVGATDPATFAGIAVLLAGTALVATYIPARRATRVNPVIAMRAD
jgi:predicted permease